MSKKINTEWNLSQLYKSVDDPRIEGDMDIIESAYNFFADKYKNTKDYLLKETNLFDALKDYEKILDLSSSKPYFYLKLSLDKNSQDYNDSHYLINKNTEPFYYTIYSSTSNYNEFHTLLINDAGSNNFATICRAAKTFDCKICLSGTGADEIISDYGFNGNKIYAHSNFGGKFPENLETVFPWASFYGSTLESYIAKEEYVGGSFGIEMRYPFLDKDLVQEFLWLHQDLKNKEYKAPIDYYFNKNNYPYAKHEKRGF